MPMALYFAFTSEMGVAGLWLGFTIASLALDIGFYIIIYWCDWEQLSEKIHAKLEIEEQKRQLLLSQNQKKKNNELIDFSQPYNLL